MSEKQNARDFIIFLFFHGKRDSFFLQIYSKYLDMDHIAYLYDLAWMLDIAVTNLRKMNQAILMNADIHKRTKSSSPATLWMVPSNSMPGFRSFISNTSVRSSGEAAPLEDRALAAAVPFEYPPELAHQRQVARADKRFKSSSFSFQLSGLLTKSLG